MKGGSGVAEGGIGGEMCGLLGACSIDGAVPVEGVALVGEGVASGGGPDLEVECAERVATVDVGEQQVGMQTCVGTEISAVLERILLVVADACENGITVNRHCMQMHQNSAILSMNAG